MRGEWDCFGWNEATHAESTYALRVEVQHWLGLTVEGGQAWADVVSAVVAALDQGLASDLNEEHDSQSGETMSAKSQLETKMGYESR